MAWAACGSPSEIEPETQPAPPEFNAPVDDVPDNPGDASIDQGSPAVPGAVSAQDPRGPTGLKLAELLCSRALRHDSSMKMLRELTRRAPGRSAGSESHRRAIEWAERQMTAIGLSDVHREPVIVPAWKRGDPEIARVSAGGRSFEIRVLALTGSVPTKPPGIVDAELLMVADVDELAQRGDEARGKVVFFNQEFPRGIVDSEVAYGQIRDTVEGGVVSASRFGAVGVLVRSATLADDEEPRVTPVAYHETYQRIPAATISTQTADALAERIRSEEAVRISLQIHSTRNPELIIGHNLVGEIRGLKRPAEIVLLAARLDSWDLGECAHDNASGVVHCLEAVRLMLTSGIRPARTIRVVLLLEGDEPGRALAAYARDHVAELELHVAAIGSHAGAFNPLGFVCEASESQLSAIRKIVTSLDPLSLGRFAKGKRPRLAPLRTHGVPVLGLHADRHSYYDRCRSTLDVYDSVNPRYLALGCASIAYLASSLADSASF